MSTEIFYIIRQQLGNIGIPILLVSGNIGNVLLLIMFIKSLKRHPNSCSLYLLFASFGNLFVIDTALISTFYGMNNVEPTHLSNAVCKLRWFGGHALFMLSRCCMVAACIDRWAVCSQNVRIRSLCQIRTARYVTGVIVLLSIILPAPLFLYYDNGTGRCILLPTYTLAYTIFSFLAISVIPLLLLIIFSLLTCHNLHLIHSRVLPTSGTVQSIRIHKRDHDLMKMLAGEVVIYCLTQSTFPVNTMYGYFTSFFTANKSQLRIAVESLISFIIHPILSFTYCCTQFYVCALVSKSFRRDCSQLFRKQPPPDTGTRHTIRFAENNHTRS
ncbi:unnamed protein product [Adineta ricciae]|uniref:G-protein coupled receptors family 1 profile domain-containing protein n=1 Tax=Adineta ricciae TaxID=249248 RepID=A0A814UB21_ADIRI|nr:unnamed protein product [Adineta ricciae]